MMITAVRRERVTPDSRVGPALRHRIHCQVGRMHCVVQHRLPRHDRLRQVLTKERSASVQVAVPLREVAGRDRQAQAVPGGNVHADGTERDLVLIDLVRLNQGGLRLALTLARPHDPFLEIDGAPIPVDLAEPRRPVGIDRR